MTNTIKTGDLSEFARASVGLEGFEPSKADELAAQRFVAGESTLAEFVHVKPGSGDK
ncbi:MULTISPECIES: antitoxin VbhA family protein [Pseudomonadota]|uniref:Antitoxin VbhA family protein n=1 Tax=Advenella alkanexedens TaxID=1481665 RepID=A0ABS6NRW3_9BURK|nr:MULTISPECIES: antitoxin VbhA family protein [Pseudomonadota]MBV4398384.1 antitoxin VbhA family protein [Advenella alkanexedens]